MCGGMLVLGIGIALRFALMEPLLLRLPVERSPGCSWGGIPAETVARCGVRYGP